MSTMITFQDDSAGVVDDWMDLIAPSSSTAQQSVKNDPLQLVSNELKSGLGFNPSSKKGEKTQIDHVAKLLEKQQRATKRKQEEAHFNEHRDLHGMIEEGDIEESKTSLATMTKKNAGAVGSSKPAQSKKAKAAKNNNEKAKATEPVNVVTLAVTTTAQLPSPTGPIESSSFTLDGPESEKPYRKRKKTRSKQKNIRRDNRPETAKPEYLLQGGGRPLTPATKAVLGIEAKPKDNRKHNAHNNKPRNNNNNNNEQKNNNNQSDAGSHEKKDQPKAKKQKVVVDE